jgi:hypothetical protein
VDVGEREIATDANKPFLAEMELAKMICEAMCIEFWRAVLADELKQEGKKASTDNARLKIAPNTDQPPELCRQLEAEGGPAPSVPDAS